MNHLSRLTFSVKLLVWGLLFMSASLASAQKNYPTVPLGNAESTGPERPAVKAFRQHLTLQETARKEGIMRFLRQKPGIRRDYTDLRGTYHYLHHIDANGKPVYYQNRSNLGLATSINANKLWSGGSLGLNLQGQGMEVSAARSRLGMWEPSPLRTTHVEFSGRAITRDTPLFSSTTTVGGGTHHATHVAGTMVAAGVNPQARGMANQARLDAYEAQTDEKSEMQTAAAEGMLISNHSYGPDFVNNQTKLGVYDEECKDFDNITFLNKNYLQFHAAGNDRDDSKNITYDILIGSGNAKNIVTVGAVKRLGEAGYTGPASVEMSDFSSYGPTDDGRIKPDFVAPGVEIFSAQSNIDDAYANSNGTSMASPGSAGALFLLQQHYKNTKNGAFMRAATLKGLGIHTADEAGSSLGPDYRFGWGLLNLEKAIAVINQTGGQHLLEEATLVNGATYRKSVTSTGGPFRTTICWTDVPGTPLVNGGANNRTPMLVNDLDVRLVEATTNNTVAQLPWKLDPTNSATAAIRGDNVVDNVEQIFVENLPAGQYFVQVTHKGTLQQGPQEFSVFVTGTAPSSAVVKVNSTDPSATEGGAARQLVSSLSAKNGRIAAEEPADPGVIRFERSNTVGSLVVNYQIEGTATNGVDFASLPTSVTFGDGQSVLEEEVNPLEDDIVEGDESIIITLLDSDAYDPDPTEITTTLTLRDNDGAGAALSITGVTTVSCTTLNAGQRRMSFTPQYAGLSGQPISFSVINELSPTTSAGPYTLNLYTDNPVITLKATQSGTAGEASFVYNWLVACNGSVTPPPSASFGIAGVTTVSCATLSAGQRQIKFTPQYAGLSGQPVSFQVVNELLPTTAAGPYTLNPYIDNPTLTLKATQSGTAGEASFIHNWLAACNGSVTPPTSPFSITGVTTVSCTVVSPSQRQVSFTPQYAGTTGQPISFSVVNELSPTTAPGPYTLQLYADNPVITLKATQSGTAGEVSFAYNWLGACSNGSGARVGAEPVAELNVRVLGNPVQNGQVRVEVRGAAGQSLRLQLTDLRGQAIGTHSVKQAGLLEQHVFEIGRQAGGVLLLRASTPAQSQTLKVLTID